MRFVCDSCRAQYMISDDKIGAKGVKIRCKKCGHVIVVRPAGAAAPKDDGSSEASASESTATPATTGAANANAAAMLATLGSPPEGGLFTGVEEDEIGAVFDQVLNSGSHKLPAGEPVGDQARESKPSTPDAVRKLAEAEEQPDEPKAAPPANDWYVAIDEKQVGPLTVEKIKEHWDRGEVGPDSLCWRAGFSDWIPLSEATELASVLAPRPAKPVIVAPAAVASQAPSAPAPVESAFSAGAAAKNNRPEIPAAPALGQEPTSSGWKPSAASVLASLVKEENDALSKPPPKPLVEEKAAPGLLDLPPEPAMAPAARAAPMMAAAAEPMRAPQPAAMPYAPVAPAPAYAQPAPAYGQPAYAGAGYPQPAYPGYPPSAAHGAQGGNNKTVMLAAIGAAALVLILVGGFFAFRDTSSSQPSEPTPVAAVTPPQPKAPEPATPPAAKVEPPSAAVANPATPTPAPGAVATPPPAPAPGTGVAAGGSPATPAATPTPPPATPPATPPVSEAVAKANPGTREPSSVKTGERKPTSESSRPSSGTKPEAIAKPAAKPADDGLGDDFDDLFGTKKPASKPGSGEKTPSTYIPPAPGSGASDVPERLGQSDIMAVVVANKPAIMKCVSEQRKKDPGLNGRLVMRWSIQTNGRTTGVSVKSEEFKKTYMASCISGLIKGWNFPKHKKQGEPIDFPFIF